MGTRAIRKYRFEPDYSAPPGESLLELLASLDMSQAEFAIRADLAPKTVNLILKGRAPVTPETALKIERVTGSTAQSPSD